MTLVVTCLLKCNYQFRTIKPGLIFVVIDRLRCDEINALSSQLLTFVSCFPFDLAAMDQTLSFRIGRSPLLQVGKARENSNINHEMYCKLALRCIAAQWIILANSCSPKNGKMPQNVYVSESNCLCALKISLRALLPIHRRAASLTGRIGCDPDCDINWCFFCFFSCVGKRHNNPLPKNLEIICKSCYFSKKWPGAV